MISENHLISIVDRYLSEQDGGRESVVSEITDKANDPEWSLVPLRFVIALRDRGHFEVAANAASLILSRIDISNVTAFDICWNACIVGFPDRVVHYLERLLESGALSGDQKLFLSVQQTRIGRHDRAETVLEALARHDAHLQQEIETHRQFFDFYKKYGPDVAWQMMHDIKQKFIHVGIDSVERAIHQSLEEKKPYLLLRLGDGEGSVMRIDPDDTRKYADYYAANQREFLRIWFDDESVGKSERFDQVINDFNAVIGNADTIGGIYDAAIEHEYRLGSRRGIAWVVNTMRKVLDLAECDPDWASRTSVHHLGLHYDLLLSGALARLLRGRAHLGLVSCQSELPAALKRTYDIGEIEFYKVPGEQIHKDTLGQSAVEGAHWPDRFFELCDTFDRAVDRRGQLFLVAAGLLGKIYANKLKAAGAVVLDIGAVADLWMGKITRTFPHLPPEVALKLDADEALLVVQAGGMADLSISTHAQAVGGALVVFEPNPDHQNLLKGFFAERGLRAEFVGKCLADHGGQRRLHVTKSLGCSSVLESNDDILRRYSVGPAFKAITTVEVDCVRYDEFLAAGHVSIPDVLVLSEQGLDYEALLGFGDVLRSCLGVKVRSYMYEVYKNQKLLPDIVRHLDGFGLVLRRMTSNDNFDGDVVEVDAWFTCAASRVPDLSKIRQLKLKTLEQAWQLQPQHKMFTPGQFN